MTGNRVFIADDEQMMRQALKAILRAGKFRIVGETSQGNEVLYRVKDTRPDIVCLDIHMPNKTGMEVLRELREECPSIKVVMVTGDADAKNVKEAIELGARDFILKPFNAAQILEHMLRLVKSE